MATVINSFAISGINGYIVSIECDTIFGQPLVSIVGLGDTAIKEARERLEAAIIHAKYEFPKMKIVINLAPGCGKSMVAKRIPTILPKMSEEEALEVTRIYSVCGLLKNKGTLITERPFRAPHHNASTNSLVGGGNNAMPGEISLAHNGVLFLDEIAEFNSMTLDSLRQPMEDHKVTISRVRYTHTFPASFMLIAAMNPCPCGYYGYQRCRCTDYEVLKYRRKISGPILDRIDIQKHVEAVDFMNLSTPSKGVSSKELREKVERARKVQRERFKDVKGIYYNAQMNTVMVNTYCEIDSDSRKLFQLAYDRFKYSARTFHKFLKVARTFADMDGSEKVRKQDVAKALMCRDLDKEQANMIVV